MGSDIVYVAVDVDDKSFHGCGIYNETGEVIEFASRPTAGHLVEKLKKFSQEGKKVKVCYEATYLGYSLQRDLVKHGFECDVIAPSLVPVKHGKSVKTDRIDCREMAVYYMNGQLTAVNIPTEEEEVVRDIVRTRRFLSEQQTRLKLHILSTCRRMGLNYREGEDNKKRYHWTKAHREWLAKETKTEHYCKNEYNITMLLGQLEEFERRIGLYDSKLVELAQRGDYLEKVKALCCYRGIELLTAMTLITELRDIKRFSHPKQLCSYAGMDLREYSSGGHERRYRMSKMGNRHIRTSVIESCQRAWKTPKVGKALRARRADVKDKFINIADRCMARLYKKSRHLLQNGKMANKVKVACAREMLCFVWESLQAVQTV